MPQRLWRLTPPFAGGRVWVYVYGAAGGIHVRHSNDPRTRLLDEGLRRLDWWHLGPCGDKAFAAAVSAAACHELHRTATRSGGKHGRCFYGVTREQVVAVVQRHAARLR